MKLLKCCISLKRMVNSQSIGFHIPRPDAAEFAGSFNFKIKGIFVARISCDVLSSYFANPAAVSWPIPGAPLRRWAQFLGQSSSKLKHFSRPLPLDLLFLSHNLLNVTSDGFTECRNYIPCDLFRVISFIFFGKESKLSNDFLILHFT